MNAIFFTFVAVLGAAIGIALRLPRINAITAFAVMWTPLLIVVSIPGLVQPPLSQDTWNMIWLAIVGVVLGCVLGALPAAVSTSTRKPAVCRIDIDVRKLVRWHWWLIAALSGYAALQIYKLRDLVAEAGGWTTIFSTSGIDFRRAQLDAPHLVVGLSGAAIIGLGYVLFLGFASLVTGALLWRIGRTYLALVPLFVTAIYSILVLQRTFFFMSTLLFIVVVMLLPRRTTNNLVHMSQGDPSVSRRRAVVAQLVALTLTVIALFLPLYFRNTGRGSNVAGTSLSQYLVSGIVGLSRREQLGLLSAEPGSGYGAYTFTLMFRVLNQLGLPIPSTSAFYEFYDIAVAGVRYPTNTGTSILDFRLDFGFIGVFVAFFVIAFAASALQQLPLKSSVYALPISAGLLVTLFWSFFVTPILNDFKYQVSLLFGCYVLRRIVEVTEANLPRSLLIPVSS